MMTLLNLIVIAQVVPDVDPAAALDLIVGSASSYGILGGVAAVLSVAISLFSKFFPGQWGKLPKWARYLISFFITGAGVGILAGIAPGASIGAAIGAGLMGGLAAVGINQGFKRAAEVAKKDPSGS
jgi:hypothetical protein